MVAGSRSIASQARRTRSFCASPSSKGMNGRLNSSAYRAARAGVRFLPPPPISTGGLAWAGLGRPGESRDLVVLAVVGEVAVGSPTAR